MQNNHSFSLTKYQSAVLTELGITPFESRSLNEEDGALSAANMQADIGSLKKPSNPIQALRDSVNSESQRSVNDDAKNNLSNAVASLPEHIIINFDDWNQSAQIVQDIFSAFELVDKPIHVVSASEREKRFSDYVLLWQQGDSIALQNNVLTTPALYKLQEPTIKRQLWQIISDHVG